MMNSNYSLSGNFANKTFNWTEFIINTKMYSEQLTRLSLNKYPTIDMFLNMDNVTYWLEQLKQIFVAPANVPDFTINM